MDSDGRGLLKQFRKINESILWRKPPIDVDVAVEAEPTVTCTDFKIAKKKSS